MSTPIKRAVPKMYTLPEAIARMEGFYNAQPSRATRNCNPGNMEWGEFAEAHGATHVEPAGRFAVFPNADTGFNALKALLLSPSYRDLTVQQAVYRWAPPVENDTVNYIARVCGWVGCKPDDIVSQVIA